MIGIYKITNKINNKAYIGLSTNIQHRWEQHKDPYNWKRENTKKLYKAFLKYGLDNFSFEVIEECLPQELKEKEKYYIEKYDTLYNGYNMTSGGEDPSMENHPNHKLKKQDIINIRTYYNNKKRKKEIYALYKDRIGESGFNKIWKGDTWKGIMPEVYTKENKDFHAKDTGNNGSQNGRARVNEEDVYLIRLRKKNGEKRIEVYKDYSDLLTYGSFSNIWFYQNWKNIVV